MSKSKWLVGLAIIAVGALLFFQRGSDVPPKDSTELAKQSIKIGAILPLTGDAAQYGNNDKDGILLAVKEANDAGGIKGHKIEVVFEDCQTDARLAISAFNNLHAQGIEAMIDDAVSTISLALAPLLKQNKTVLISTGASNPALSGISPFFFRVWDSDAYEGVVAAEYIKKVSSAVRLAFFFINSDYGQGLYSVVKNELTASNVQIVASETFDKGVHNFRSQIAKVKVAKPTLIYMIGYASQTGPLTKQLREAGVEAPIVGTVAMEDPEYVRLANGSAEGVVYPFPSHPSGTEVDKFQAAFKKAYGKPPGLLSDVGYDAANLIIKAMLEKGLSGEEIREALASTRGYLGASGTISFDANGDVHKPMQMKYIHNGKFETIK